MANLNETPSANRLHIGVFGAANAGKSSFLNALTGQSISIVSQQAGTTTDPVYKAMELHPLGPCNFIDTAGFSDHTALGQLRLEKTRLAAEKADIALLLLPGDLNPADFPAGYPEEASWLGLFAKKNTPVLFLLTKADLHPDAGNAAKALEAATGIPALAVSSLTGQGMAQVKSALVRLLPEGYAAPSITGPLCGPGDSVVLVMPQDLQAPKGRLILPQVQTIRELLDKQCLVSCVTTDRFGSMLASLKEPPRLIICDSQVLPLIYDQKPQGSILTTFSILFAGYKGDIDYYVESARAIGSLTSSSRVLIAECCTHAPLQEDIGRVKIPRMLKKRYGECLTVDIVSGTDFPADLAGYDLVIQCGGCMFNRKYVLSRVGQAKAQGVPMTNYGVAIAYLSEIIDKICTKW